MKYGHMPLFLNWYCNGFHKLVGILIGSMHVSTMYRDSVSVFVWCTLSSAAKIAHSLPFKQQWYVTIFRQFMTKL